MSYMMNRLVNRYKQEVSDNPTLLELMYDNCNTFLTASQIPNVYLLDKELDLSKADRRVCTFIDDISEILFSCMSLGIWVSSYENVGYFIAKALERHMFNKCVKDEYMGNILYIDTPLLLYDMKKLINRDENFVSPRLSYSLDVLYHQVYDADFIFWNRFTNPENNGYSNYDVNRLYEILLTRYNSCKGNAFVLCGSTPEKTFANFNQDTLTVMNCRENLYNFYDAACLPVTINKDEEKGENKVDGQ